MTPALTRAAMAWPDVAASWDECSAAALTATLALVGFALFVRHGAGLAARPVAAPPRAPRPVGVTVLRPCEGAEPGLADALRAPAGARVGPIEVVACTRVDDPVIAVARELGVAFVTDEPTTSHWHNPKARHLAAGLARPSQPGQPIIVLADVDAVLDAPLLDELVGALQEPGVAGAFAPPMAAPAPAWGNRLLRAALGGSLYAWPALVALTRALDQPIPMSGALVATRRADLPPGLVDAAAMIGDDLAVATSLQRRGALVMISRPVICMEGAIPLRTAVATLRRWVHVAALHAPWRLLGFPFLFAATPLLLVLALVAAALLPAPLAIVAVLAIVVALHARVRAARQIRRRLLGEPGRLIELLLVELVLLDASLRAALALLLRRELVWRSRRYRVGAGGRILAVRDAH